MKLLSRTIDWQTMVGVGRHVAIQSTYQCERCARQFSATNRFTYETWINWGSDRIYMLPEAVTKCDCDRPRCRVGAAFQRRHRQLLGVHLTRKAVFSE